jgi:hypothetical protein
MEGKLFFEGVEAGGVEWAGGSRAGWVEGRLVVGPKWLDLMDVA